MLFALLCNDKPDHLQVRLDTRPTHLEYLTSLGDVPQRPPSAPMIPMRKLVCFRTSPYVRGTGRSKILPTPKA
jgi:hypothetical protein